MKYLSQKHGVQENSIRDTWDGKSKLSIFFLGNSVPSQIKKLLARYLIPIVIQYNPIEQLPEDEKNRINSIGESFAGDFCNVINLANSTKLALTKVKQLPTKSVVLEINNALNNKDFVFEELGGITGIRSIESTNRIYGIYMLLVEADLLL